MLAYKSIWYLPSNNCIEFKTEDSMFSDTIYQFDLDILDGKDAIAHLNLKCKSSIATDIENFIRNGDRKKFTKIYPIDGVDYGE